MLYESQNKTKPIPDYPFHGPTHEYDQIELAQWVLRWIDTNWIGHPEVVAWSVERARPDCGHTSIVIRVMFDYDKDDKEMMEDVKDVEAAVFDELSTYTHERYGSFGLVEGDRGVPVLGDVCFSDTIHHSYVNFTSVHETQQGLDDLLKSIKNSGIMTKEDAAQLKEAIKERMPEQIKVDMPEQTDLDSFLSEE